MAGAIITKPMQVETPQDLGASYIIRTGEIINEGDLVGLDGNGLLVASLNGTFPTSPLGCAFFDSANASTYRTGDGVMKASIARRAKIRNATSTLVPGLAKGAPLYLSLITTPTTSNYTCVPPSSQGNNTLAVGYVDGDGTTLIVDVQSGGAAGSIGIVGINGLKQMLASKYPGYQMIGYRNGAMTTVSATLTQTDTFRTRHPSVYAAQSIVLVYQNFYMPSGGSETDGVSAVTVRASIEDTALITGLADGTSLFPVYFNGARNALMDIDGWLVSDPVDGISVPANWALMVRSAATVSAGKYPISGNLLTGGTALGVVSPDGRGNGDGKTANSDLTDSGTVTPTSLSPFGPCAVLGLLAGGPKSSVYFIGCSIDIGTGDQYGQATDATKEITAHGPIVRACSYNGIPWGNWGVGGESLETIYLQKNTKLRLGALSRVGPAAVVVGTVASNDIPFISAAQIETYLIDVTARIKNAGKIVIVPTIPPRMLTIGGTTDYYQTTANQTPSAWEATRIAANAIIRNSLITDAGGAVDYIWDWCAPIECNAAGVLTQNGGRVIVGTTYLSGKTGTATSSTVTVTDTSGPFTAPMAGALLLVTGGTGASISTTVTTGAASATQLVGDTTGMAANQTYYFQASKVFATVSSVTDGTHVVFTASITTTTGETIQQYTAQPILSVTDSQHVVCAASLVPALDNTSVYKIFQCPFTNGQFDGIHPAPFIYEAMGQSFNPAWANVV
jgi:hypothetical protein